MGDRTGIRWVLRPNGTPGATWNPVVGCTAISEGCVSCWAAGLASTRLRDVPDYAGLAAGGRWISGARVLPHRLLVPAKWSAPRGIFVCDMSDLFHEDVPESFIGAVFGVMAMCCQHTFYVLTKRPQRAFEFATGWDTQRCISALRQLRPELADLRSQPLTAPAPWPLDNVVVGCSVENQVRADERISWLLRTPAWLRMISAEPLLGPVQLWSLNDGSWYDREGAQLYDALTGTAYWRNGEHGLGGGPKLDWVIVGGESGPHARGYNVGWGEDLIHQCGSIREPVAMFHKQCGAMPLCQVPGPGLEGAAYGREQRRLDMLWPEGTRIGNPTEDKSLNGRVVRLKHGAGADPEEWPAHLRVQQMHPLWGKERRACLPNF